MAVRVGAPLGAGGVGGALLSALWHAAQEADVKISHLTAADLARKESFLGSVVELTVAQLIFFVLGSLLLGILLGPTVDALALARRALRAAVSALEDRTRGVPPRPYRRPQALQDGS